MIWKTRVKALAVLGCLLTGIHGAKAQALWVQTSKALALYGQPVPAGSYTEIWGEIGNSWVAAPPQLVKWDGIQLIPKADATLTPLFQYNNKVIGTINQVTTAFDNPAGKTTGGRYPYGIASLEAYPSTGIYMYPCTYSPCTIFNQTNQTITGTQVNVIGRYPNDYDVQVPGSDDDFIIPIGAVDLSPDQDLNGSYATAPRFLPKDLRISKVPTDPSAPPPDLTASDDQGQSISQTTAPDSVNVPEQSALNDAYQIGPPNAASGEGTNSISGWSIKLTWKVLIAIASWGTAALVVLSYLIAMKEPEDYSNKKPNPKQWVYHEPTGEYHKVIGRVAGGLVTQPSAYRDRWAAWYNDRNNLRGSVIAIAIGAVCGVICFRITNTHSSQDSGLLDIIQLSLGLAAFLALIASPIVFIMLLGIHSTRANVGPRPYLPTPDNFGPSSATSPVDHPAADDLAY